MNTFALIAGAGGSLELRALTAGTSIFYDDRPILKTVVRCVSRVYRGERVDACQIAKDLESCFRAVTRTQEISVRAMVWATTTSDQGCIEQELVDLERVRASSPR